MDAYYKAVRHLEERFDDLKLNHVLRKYNEAADALTMMASELATIPSDVFVSDLHKPSVDYKEDRGSGHSPVDRTSSSKAYTALEPEDMDIEPEEPEPDDLPD